MIPFAIKMYVSCFVIVLFIYSVEGQDRKITAELNPGCTSCTSNDTLMYIRAAGLHNTIHQVWDFTRGIPTVIYAIAGENSTMNISWDHAKPSRFQISQKPQYSFAAVIDKLIEYNDTDDHGHLDALSPRKVYQLQGLSWWRNASIESEQEAMVRVRSAAYNGRQARKFGDIEIKLDLLPYKDYATDLPHLIHTVNSSLFDISLINMTTSPEYNGSRFALHFVIVSTDGRNDSMKYTMRKSLDDEHTPGVFEIIEIRTPESVRSGDGGFIQFRPVGYTEQERNVASSTIAHVSEFNRTWLPHDSTLKVFYRDEGSSLLIQDMFVSFGEAGDGFYKQRNFTGWSFTIGYGSPPLESFSLFVILVISIGLGVPVLLALSGIVFVIVKRYKHRNAPTRFTDDE